MYLVFLSVFINIKKAFDTVDHEILLNKLAHYGIRGIGNKLLRSYLSERNHYVKLSCEMSTFGEMTCGVPQGSILGPLLFILYINDLHNTLSYSKCFHFADDTSLIVKNNSFKKLVQTANKDLQSISEWLRSNKLSLNVDKSELLIFIPLGKEINSK